MIHRCDIFSQEHTSLLEIIYLLFTNAENKILLLFYETMYSFKTHATVVRIGRIVHTGRLFTQPNMICLQSGLT